MSWTSAQKCPLPAEVNISGGISRADASREYRAWELVRDIRAVLGDLKASDITGQFTTSHHQIGVTSSVGGRTIRCDWSANDLKVSGGYHYAKITNPTDPDNPKTHPIRYCLIDGKGFETMKIEYNGPTYIRRIKEVAPPTIQDDGHYTPAEYSVIPTAIMPGQDLFTLQLGAPEATLGGTRIEGMHAYTQGDKSGHVHRTFRSGINIHGDGNDKTVVEWKHFGFDGYPVTEFETSGPVSSIIQVPRGYTGEPQRPGGASTCTGFFVPDTA